MRSLFPQIAGLAMAGQVTTKLPGAALHMDAGDSEIVSAARWTPVINKRPRQLALLLMALWTSLASGCGSGGSSQSDVTTPPPNVTTAACTGSSPTWTSTPDWSSVESCISSASKGDTIKVTAGSATWTSTLTINKGITLQGAGTTSGSSLTQINYGVSPLISISGFSSDAPVRVTGIYYDLLANTGSDRSAIKIYGTNTSGSNVALTQVRIDNNKFNKGKRQVFVNGWAYGVIDHNQFINADIGVMVQGDNTRSWDRPIVAGMANAMFIEDNTFFVDNNRLIGGGGNANNEQVYHQEGARSVIRYNTFNFTQTNDTTFVIDTHGNDFAYYDGTSTSFRGNPLIELYNNTVTSTGNWAYWIHDRGGSILSHDNTITVAKSSPVYIKLHEYETTCCSPARTVWPAQDQVFNSFFWNETLNGRAIIIGDFDYYNAGTQTLNQVNRDFFLNAPQASGGKECFVAPGETSNCANTGRAGGSTASPTTGDTSTMIFVASGANAYYPYTPYIYPHPLVKETSAIDVSPPNAPSNLRVQ